MSAATAHQPLRALLWVLGATLSFAVMAIGGRTVQTELNTFELMLYRSAIGWVLIASVIVVRGRWPAAIAMRAPGLHLRRNLLHFIGQNAWFYAMTLIPLAQVIALEMSNPIWVALLAPFFLGERLTSGRVVAALLGFSGILVVLRPGLSPLAAGHGIALLAALGFAMTTIYTRRITRTDTVLSVVFWMTLMQAAMALVLSLPGGVPLPSAAILPALLLVGVTGLSAHFCLASALRAAPAIVVAPMEFIRLPVIALAGMWIYGEPLEAGVFAGAAIIVAGILYNMRSERGPR